MKQLIRFCVVGMVGFAPLGSFQPMAIADGIPQLFHSEIRPAARPAAADPTVVRSRTVGINLDMLDSMKSKDRFVFNLFEDATFTAVLENIKNRNTWVGSIEGKPAGTFTLVMGDEDVLSAIIRVPGKGIYRVRSLRDGVVVIHEIDETRFPPCGTGPVHGVLGGGGVVAGGGCDDGSVIDVLVVYTPLARQAAGGTAAIEAEIDLAFANTNTAYTNSLIGMQLNLIYVEEIAYNEAGSYVDHLYRLTDPADGYMDEVHTLRDQYGADMVALLVADGEYCGVAWLMQTLSPAFEQYAFSVTTWYCAANFVLAHELGHNQGCCHDRDNCGQGVFDYSYGYRFFGNGGQQWRTVMSYSPGTRIPHFSNPDVLFDGQPTGVPPGNPDDADNALTINQTAFTIANFRCSVDQSGIVLLHQKISDTEGGFIGILDNSDNFGISVASLGDLDGDGVGDLAVGAYGDDDGGANRGAVWVLFLNPDGTVKSQQKISDLQGGFIGILDNGDRFGTSVASLGDLDGDGVGDLAVGALSDDDGGDARGAVWVLFLNADGTVKSHQKISSTEGDFTGILDDSDVFGWSLASLGDLDGDGVGDLAVGAILDDDGGDARGAVWVLFLNSDGTVKAHQKFSDIQGGFTGSLDDGDGFGWSVASLGDLDGDGVGDLAVGALRDDDGGDARGAVWVLFLNPDGTVKSHQKISNTEGGFTGILDDFDNFGVSVASLGDLDGDGVGDLAVGAFLDDGPGTDRGAVRVLFLNADGTVKAHEKISHTQGGFTGTLDNGDRFGVSVTSLGDLDGDRVADLAVGAQLDDDGGINRGAVWVLFLDGVPQTPCPWDIDGSNDVGVKDLLILLGEWGPCPKKGDCPADFDDTGDVGVKDLLDLLGNWGVCP